MLNALAQKNYLTVGKCSICTGVFMNGLCELPVKISVFHWRHCLRTTNVNICIHDFINDAAIVNRSAIVACIHRPPM